MAKCIFNNGDKVWSPIYGDGKVVRVDHSDDTMKVEFEDGDSWWYTFGGTFKTDMHGKLGEVCSLFPAGSRIVTPEGAVNTNEKAPTFKVGDKCIWLKPVEVEIVEESSSTTVRARVTLDRTDSPKGETWNFNKSTGIWSGGTLEQRGRLVHSGFSVISGPDPDRKPACPFKDKEVVLVRDSKDREWQIAAFKEYRKCHEYPYDTYSDEGFRYCIPYAGNECKIGEVTDD